MHACVRKPGGSSKCTCVCFFCVVINHSGAFPEDVFRRRDFLFLFSFSELWTILLQRRFPSLRRPNRLLHAVDNLWILGGSLIPIRRRARAAALSPAPAGGGSNVAERSVALGKLSGYLQRLGGTTYTCFGRPEPTRCTEGKRNPSTPGFEKIRPGDEE